MDLYEEISDLEYFFFDLDKTIWNWNSTLIGAEELIDTLKRSGKEVFFFTDNTLLTASQYAEKLNSMGIEAEESDIITSGQVTGKRLEKDGISEAYVIGESGLIKDIEKHGIDITDRTDSVVLGFDRQFSYEKAKKAFDILRKGGNLYVCSEERTFRTEKNIKPHQGLFNSVLQTEDATLTGVPSKSFRKELERRFTFLRSKSVMIGDRKVDIELGNKIGMRTAAVMSGDLDRDKLRKMEEDDKPDFGISSLHSLRKRII